MYGGCLLCPLYPLVVRWNTRQADLAIERERHLTTMGKRAERTKLDFRCPICRSAIGQASCLICARRRQPGRQLTFHFCCSNMVKCLKNLLHDWG